MARLAGELELPAGASGWKLHTISNMKLRTFIPRGERLDLEAKLVECTGDAARVTVQSRRGKRTVAAATVLLETEGSA